MFRKLSINGLARVTTSLFSLEQFPFQKYQSLFIHQMNGYYIAGLMSKIMMTNIKLLFYKIWCS